MSHSPVRKNSQQRTRERPIPASQPDALQALWTLSDFPDDVSVESVSDLIRKAPDPETACRTITSHIHDPSEVLDRKWRKIIHQTWFDHHPHVSHLLDIPLTSSDVTNVGAMRDAHVLLQELGKRPAAVVWENNERVIDAGDIPRFVEVLPSLRGKYVPEVENEWSCVTLRRLRALLQTLRLVRVYQGKLVLVRSRYERFVRLPPTLQFYTLWHADVYHLDWAQFASQWAPYVRLIQNYLPLLWDVEDGIEEGELDNIHDVTSEIIAIYRPLWQQEGLLNMSTHRTFFDVYEQSALPAVLERLLLCDIMARYGLIRTGYSLVGVDSSHSLLMESGDFTWTEVGEVLLSAERSQNLPCGMDLLS